MDEKTEAPEPKKQDKEMTKKPDETGPFHIEGHIKIFDPETNSCVDVTTFESLAQFCDKFGIDDF